MNYKNLICLVMLGLCMCLLVGMLLNAGCLTMAKDLMKQKESVQVATINEPPDLSNLTRIEVTIKPEQFDFSVMGKLNLKDYYTWHRENVSGLKDMTVKVTVYDYKFLPKYQWHNDADNKYYWQFPNKGNKTLLVFAQLYMDGETQEDDPRYYVGDPWDRFRVQYQGSIFKPDLNYAKAGQIKELEDTYNQNDDTRVQPFGYRWEWRKITGNATESGWRAVSPEWLRMGISNSWDGYIMFEVPENATAKDIYVLSQWDTFGNPWWQLQ